MAEIYVKNKSDNYYYASFEDVTERDLKYRQLKSSGYKKINVGDYKAISGKTIYFITRK